jgi:prepilin-type N-terminal cleavage/methylation domain-containing protein
MQRNFKTNTHRGFTLIEILIVVVILGILSSIVIPQFTNATENAEETSSRAQLNILRGQMSMYWVTNGASAEVGSNVEEVVAVLDDAGLLTSPLLDVDQDDNNLMQLSGDFTMSWDEAERQFLVAENGTPTGW